MKQVSLITTPNGSLEFVGWSVPTSLIFTDSPETVEEQMRLPVSYRSLTKVRFTSVDSAVKTAEALGYKVQVIEA